MSANALDYMATVPIVGEYDVVIAGGGMAGFGAACAAARRGVRTLLIERLEILGGLGSSACAGNFSYGDDTLPLAQGKVFDDIWDGLLAMKAIGVENGWRAHSNRLFHIAVSSSRVCRISLSWALLFGHEGSAVPDPSDGNRVLDGAGCRDRGGAGSRGKDCHSRRRSSAHPGGVALWRQGSRPHAPAIMPVGWI